MATALGLLVLLSATALAHTPGYVKREFHTEYVKPLTKRQIPDQDLDENITLASRRSVSPHIPLWCATLQHILTWSSTAILA
jgi:hypothetical protein